MTEHESKMKKRKQDGLGAEHCHIVDAIPFIIPLTFSPRGKNGKKGKEINDMLLSNHRQCVYYANTKQIIHNSVCFHTCNSTFFFYTLFLKHENIWVKQNKKKTTNSIEKKYGVMIYSKKIVNTWY